MREDERERIEPNNLVFIYCTIYYYLLRNQVYYIIGPSRYIYEAAYYKRTMTILISKSLIMNSQWADNVF